MNQTEKILKTAAAYLGYAKYCKNVADDYESQGDFDHASWYRREQLDYLRLVDELEASL